MTERNDTSPEGDLVITRSEQRLRAGTERVPVERVRIVKRIVEETRQVPVTVRREELHIDREPISGQREAGMGERAGDLVLTLSEEVPVVTTAVRPVERVRIVVDRIAGEQEVHAELAQERIEVTGAARARPEPAG